MTKARELLNLNGNGSNERIMSSGVAVIVMPFPAGLWEEINIKAFQQFPDPEPPKKKIKTIDGFEEIDDLTNPEYLESKKTANNSRQNLLGEAVLDICVMIPDFEQHEPAIKKLEKYSSKFPDDPDERRLEFLTRYALRTRGDYEIVMADAITQMMVSNPEVAERLAFFRREVERATALDPDAPGSNDGVQLAVSPQA